MPGRVVPSRRRPGARGSPLWGPTDAAITPGWTKGRSMTELSVVDGGNGRQAATGLPAVTAPPSPSEWTAMKQQASVIAKSGLAPRAVSTPEKILVIAMKARELSLPPMQGLSHIHIVEGRPTLSAELMVALVQRAGHKLRVLETSSQKCVVEGVRADDPRYPSRVEWTMDDARAAGVAGKGPWKSYPAAMLRARAISALCRFAFADVLMGAAYVPEELGAEVNEDGEVLSVPDQQGAAPGTSAERHQEPAEDAEVVEEGPASEKQSGYLKGLMRDLKVNRIKIEERHGLVEEWPAHKVSSWIESLQERKRVRDEEARQETGEPELSDGDLEEEEVVPDFSDMRGAATDAVPNRARKSQVDLIRTLAEEINGVDGIAHVETQIGKPLAELSRTEADQLIDELSPEEGR